MTDVVATQSPGMRPLNKGATLQISRTPILEEIELKRSEENENTPNQPIETPQENAEEPVQQPEVFQDPNAEIAAYYGAMPNPYFQNQNVFPNGFATGENGENQPLQGSYEEQQQQYFQQMMMFQQLMFSQSFYGWPPQQQQQYQNGGGRRNGRKGRKGRRRKGNKNKKESDKKSGATKLNKDAAVFTPKADFKDPISKGDPTKEASPIEENNDSSKAKEAKPPVKKSTGPKPGTWANLAAKKPSEKKPLIKVDNKSRSLSLKSRVQPSQPPLTTSSAASSNPSVAVTNSSSSVPQQKIQQPIAPPLRTHPAQKSAISRPTTQSGAPPRTAPVPQARPPSTNTHPLNQQQRRSPPQQIPAGRQPISRPLPMDPTNSSNAVPRPPHPGSVTHTSNAADPDAPPTTNTSNAANSSERDNISPPPPQQQRPSKPRPVWPKIKPSSNKITTTTIPKVGDRDSSSSEELMNGETGSTGETGSSESKEQDSASGLASDTLDEISDPNDPLRHKTLDMPMEVFTTSVAQPQMWAQLASHTKIWAKGPPPIQDLPRSKQGPKFLKHGDPRSFREKRFKKRAASGKMRRNNRQSDDIGTW